jgi:transposase-like protein
MTIPCGITVHPDRVEINHALDAGVPLRAIAEQHGVSRSTLARYKSMRDHGRLHPEPTPAPPAPVPVQPVAPQAPQAVADDDGPADHVERLRKILTMSAMRVGQAQMAREFNVAPRTIRLWLAEARRRKLKVLSEFDALAHLSDAIFALDVAKSEAMKMLFRAKANNDEPAVAAALSQFRAVIREQIELTDKLGGFQAGAGAITIKTEKSEAEESAILLRQMAMAYLRGEFDDDAPPKPEPTPAPDDDQEAFL